MAQPQPRTQARQHVVQALYQWQMTRESLNEIERQFIEERELNPKEISYFSELLHQIPRNLASIDQVLGQYIDRPIEKVDPVERAILRLSAYEFMRHLEIPYRVILNEGINLAKMFGASQSHRYVNGILDKVAHEFRAAEIKAKNNS